jgi:hypothetical protein
MPSHLWDESPRVTNVIEVIDEDAKVLLLEIKWLTQRSNLLSRTQGWVSREWERLRASFCCRMKYYFEVRSGQTSKWGDGVLLYPLIHKLLLGCQKSGLVRPRARLVQHESFWIQTITDRLTRTSPTEAEPDNWLTRTCPDNPSWVKLDDPDLSE